MLQSAGGSLCHQPREQYAEKYPGSNDRQNGKQLMVEEKFDFVDAIHGAVDHLPGDRIGHCGSLNVSAHHSP
jgi:hypothetical protein